MRLPFKIKVNNFRHISLFQNTVYRYLCTEFFAIGSDTHKRTTHITSKRLEILVYSPLCISNRQLASPGVALSVDDVSA